MHESESSLKMAAKLLTLLISAFLLLSLLSNNINVNAAETKTGVEDDLGLDHLNDKANEALADPIDEQESKNVSDKTVDEKDDVEVENKNKDEEETAKELSANEGDGVGEESDQAVNKEGEYIRKRNKQEQAHFHYNSL